VLVLLPLLPLRYTVERLKIRPAYDRNPAWARALRVSPRTAHAVTTRHLT